jgi:predicted nucleotide-binding protein (sugar kinase/HSP70/actin superfamily)
VLSGAVVLIKVFHCPCVPIEQKSAAMLPLPSKKARVLSQPTLNTLASPASLAQVTVICPVFSAWADGKKKKEVPNVRNQTASKRGSFT